MYLVRQWIPSAVQDPMHGIARVQRGTGAYEAVLGSWKGQPRGLRCSQ